MYQDARSDGGFAVTPRAMGSAAWNPQSLRPSPPGGVPGTARTSGRAGFHGCAVWAAPTARVKECVATGVGGTRYAAVRQTSADSGEGGLAVPRPHHDRAAPVQHGRPLPREHAQVPELVDTLPAGRA